MPEQYNRMPDNENEDEDNTMEEGENPTISIPVDVLPESENWKDGKTYDISMTVKQVGKGQFEILEAEEETPEEEKAEGGTEENE
jgi:hypothetical protein